VAVGLLAILTVGGVAWREATNSLLSSTFENLTAIETSKARQIENYFDGVEDQIQQLAGDLTIIEATVRFNRGFEQIALEPLPDDLDPVLEEYYDEQFLPRLAENTTGTPDYGVFEPGSQAAKMLQYLYIADNANAVGVKQFLDNADDGSEYSRWHEHYHPSMRSMLDHFGFYDLFFVDINTGDIVYTVFKEADYGTNLLSGPYRNSGLADVVREVMADPVRQNVQIVDFRPYAPSYNSPAAFTAVPVYNGDHPVGILALQIPITQINAVMTSEENWVDEGMGASGETYLVGADRLMRSNSRFLIENKPTFLSDVRSSGVAEDVVDKMDALDSTILLQRIDSAAAVDAIAGSSDSTLIEDFRGVEVLSSYSPLDIRGLDWVILSEIDRDEALAPVDRLLRRVLIATAIFIPLVALASIWLGRRFLSPIYRAVDVSRSILDGRVTDEEIPDGAELEFDPHAPGVFGVLGGNMNKLIGQIDAEKQRVHSEHTQFMRSLTGAMPGSVGERVRVGELDVEDVGPRCYAVAITAPGLQVNHAAGQQDPFESADEFRSALDESAEEHGVDLFANVGFEYLGIVGLTASYLDSTDRAVRFAEAVMGIAATLDSVAAFGTRVSIDVSPMRGVMDDASPFGYVVQGDAIQRAQAILAESRKGSIVLTETVRQHLDDELHDAVREEIAVNGETVVVWRVGQVADADKSAQLITLD